MQNWSLETEIGERISALQERLGVKYNFLGIVEFTHRCLKSDGELIPAQSTLQTLLGPRTVTHMEAWEFHFASTTAKDAKVRLSWTVKSSKESALHHPWPKALRQPLPAHFLLSPAHLLPQNPVMIN